MGKQYPALEALMDSMDQAQLLDLHRLIRDAQDHGKRGVQARARRMGFPPGIIR
jgi:hypothetical protein